jgi:NADH:ubiquinone oxidoreductase subunit 6 (subunit J)
VRRGAALAVAPAFAVAGVLLWALARTPLPVAARGAPAASVRQLGAELMGRHAASLLVVGVLLTIALLGAVVLASHGVDDGGRDGP